MLSVGRSDDAKFETSKISARAFAAGREALAKGDTDLARAAFRWARRADPGNPLFIHGEAVVAHRTGNVHEAEYLYRRVFDMAMRAFGAGDPRLALAGQGLVELLLDQGRYEEAETLGRYVVDGPGKVATEQAGMPALRAVTRICDATGRLDAALAIHERALTWRRGIFGQDHHKVGACAAAIGELKRRIAIRGERRATGPAAQSPGSALHTEPECADGHVYLM